MDKLDLMADEELSREAARLQTLIRECRAGISAHGMMAKIAVMKPARIALGSLKERDDLAGVEGYAATVMTDAAERLMQIAEQKIAKVARRLQAAALPVEEPRPELVLCPRCKRHSYLRPEGYCSACVYHMLKDANSGPVEEQGPRPVDRPLDVCRALDAFQHEYEQNTRGNMMPGNDLYCGKLMEIVAMAREALYLPAPKAEEGKAEPRPGGLRSIEQAAREYVEAKRAWLPLRLDLGETLDAAWTNLCVAVDGWTPEAQAGEAP